VVEVVGMNRVDLVIWALRVAIIAVGFIIGYMIGASEHQGIMATYFNYCKTVMP
jgi:hypothetical protein